MTRLFTGLIACGLIAGAFTSANASIVLSNNGGTGDDFTNATTTNTGQAVGATGWYYNNVRNDGQVGISTDLPRSGNGSVYFQGTNGPGGNSSKSDIEFLPNATANGAGNFSSGGVLGTLAELNSFGYDWYRAAGSAASNWLHPSLRLMVASPDLSQFGYLVFEREVNRDTLGVPPGSTTAMPTDQWVSDDVFGADYRLWSTGNTLPFNQNGTNGPVKYYDALHLSEWQSQFGTYLVLGISSGIGSGWGAFEGAVDNITFGFRDDAPVTYNFEVRDDGVVPELSALITWGVLALSSIISCQRRR
jgi:hypothetical protein